MKNVRIHLIIGLFAIGFGIMTLGGCIKSRPSRFYVLRVLIEPDQHIENNLASSRLIIGIGPVNIAKYLDRSRIVLRTDEMSAVEISEFDLWAGSLKEDIPDIISENMSRLLQTDRIVSYPWRNSVRVDYQVAIDLLRFDGSLGETVTLTARWSIFRNNGKNMINLKKSVICKTVEEDGYSQLIDAMSQALADLSLEIAKTIMDIEKEST